MKIEVHCPQCSGGYLLEMEALERGLPCPGCGMQLGSGGPAVAAPPPEQVDRPAETLVETAPVAVAAPSRAASEVVCPRCNLHFKPRGATPSARTGGARRPVVLVVEDMAYFREIAAEALAGEFEVLAVETKLDAEAALRRGGVDLMVLDLTLDGGDGGLELLRDLHAKPCPILIYTAQDESEMYGDSWDELRTLGADDIVIKGMNVGDELTRKVDSLLGRAERDE